MAKFGLLFGWRLKRLFGSKKFVFPSLCIMDQQSLRRNVQFKTNIEKSIEILATQINTFCLCVLTSGAIHKLRYTVEVGGWSAKV